MNVQYWLLVNGDEIREVEESRDRLGMDVSIPDRKFEYYEGVLDITELSGAFHNLEDGRIVVLFKGGSETWAIKFSPQIWSKIQSRFE